MMLENAHERPVPIERLEATGAIAKGHFRLSSGRHSDTYVQCAMLLKDPREAVEIGRALAEVVTGEFDLVLSPALGALLVGFTTALAAGCPMIFAERVEGVMRLRRGFEIPAGAGVLVVEDVITTGGSALELIAMVENAQARVAGVACIIERGTMDAGYPVYSLIRLDAESSAPDECPLCREGRPIDSPGSRLLT